MVTPLFKEPRATPSPLRPSLFELLAQEQLRDLLHPVFRYVLSYLTQRYPRYLLTVLNHHEEAFALLLLLVERHHLRKHNASLSEHFYQLRLVPSLSIPTPRLSSLEPPARSVLSRRQRWGLLFFLVGLPYARARAQDYFERLGGRQDDGATSGAEGIRGVAMTKAQRAFKMFYPYVNLAVDLSFLSCDLAYLFEQTSAYRPWHRWLGLQVQRHGPENLPVVSATSIWSKLPPLLPPLLLLLKLSQWWYSPSSPRTLASTTSSTSSAIHAQILPPRPLPILPSSGILPLTPPATPPRTPPLDARSGVPELSEERPCSTYTVDKVGYGICPLCRRKWQNPAVLPSGWVVCWRCGWDAVEGENANAVGRQSGEADGDGDDEEGEDSTRSTKVPDRGRKGRCPITGVEFAPNQLRRVLV